MDFQVIVLIFALIVGGIMFVFLTLNKKNIAKEGRLDDDEKAIMTANELINVKDIRNKCLHTNDGYIFVYLEVDGICMDLYSESEKLDYCRKISAMVAQFRFPYQYFAISSPFEIKHKLTADTEYLRKSDGLCRQLLEDDINNITRLVVDENKIDRRFFISVWSDTDDERTMLKRAEMIKTQFAEAGVDCEVLGDKEIAKMYNLFSNPAYVAYEQASDNVYLTMSRVIANND